MVLLDINMPRKNGFEALEEVRANPDLKSLPVVMLTTSDRPEDIIRAYDSGATSYIPKPLDLDGLRRMARMLAEYWTTVSRLPKR
jgi:CheY-like chemotaxis protein